MSRIVPSSPPARHVVGHEGPFRLQHVEHRMPPVDDLQLRLFDDLRPAVVPLPGQFGQGHQHVELGQHVGRGLHPPPRGGHRVAEFQEQFVLQLLRLLVGREHLLLVFLQLGRDVALGVLHRLLADVLRGDLLAVRVGDLDVVAEDLVEADLERGDARPLALLGLIAGDPLLAAVGQFAEGVQRRVVAVADEAAVAAGQAGSRRPARHRAGCGDRDRDRSPLPVDSRCALLRAVSRALSAGKARSVRPRKLRSRGLARPVVTRARSRCTS